MNGKWAKTKEQNLKPELETYLRTKARQSFDIETNNCIQFTNECWKIYHGSYWSEDCLNLQTLEEAVFEDALLAADTYLKRSQEPQEGHLVAIRVKGDTYLQGLVTGFCIGDLSVFLNAKGVKYVPTKIVNYSWSIKNDI